MKKSILIALALQATTAHAQAPAPRPAAAPADAAFGARMLGEATGEQIFHKVCAACHMHDAKGAEGAGRYPALAGNRNLAVPAYPAMVIVKGLNGMPPIGNMLTDAQVADVVNYVRSNFGNKFKGKLTPAEVKALR
jgi:mono/diheme cytochrome c family protein